MAEKVEVRGDVAQLIGGSVNEAPRQNNVVNFNLGGNAAPVQTLTDLQRKRIASLVRELCAITQESTLDVYRVSLREFGAERVKDMPQGKYHEVVVQIERWIAENKQGNPVGLSSELNAESYPISGGAKLCDTCMEKDISDSRLERLSRLRWAVCTGLIVACGLLLCKIHSQTDPSPTRDQECFYEGKRFSAGSTIRVTGEVVRECLMEPAGQRMEWGLPR
ncbi:MAG TPA: hypothetical protein VE092_06325 [Herbaspirillum sp.]|uniref:hypothetical protein n=1 Tax=Herbaspirillum sp. TaxID=1890675 RepID=UPI002D6009B2|nr:hypothetical protein [Herbaspirillum sp.]HZG19619.1 hypothetical protein [Herbaspirillum sp.]